MKTETINGFDFSQLPIKTDYVGKVDDKEWPHFLWNVTITHKDGFWTLPYKCGLGHVVKSKHPMAPEKPKKPTNADIMYSLLLDIQAADESFNDWCANLGYDNDSMSAFKIYQTCCEYAVQMRKAFSPEQIQAMSEALEDY